MLEPQQIEQIKQNTDLVALFNSYGYKAELKGKDFFTKCPFHKDDTASLSISKEKGVFHCFGCNAKGNAIQLVERIEQVSFLDACFKLLHSNSYNMTAKEKNAISNHTSNNTEQINRNELLTQAFERMLQYFKEIPNGKKYLKESRHITNDLELVGYCPSDFGSKLNTKEYKSLQEVGLITPQGKPFFAECIVFALRDSHNQIQSLYGRSTTDKGSHYYLPGPRNGVFGKYSPNEPLILVESSLDALTLLDKGFGSVLALHGVNGFDASHEDFIQHHSINDMVLLLDGDAAGREAAYRLNQKLQAKKIRSRLINLPENEDPNSYLITPERIQWLKNQLREPEIKLTSFWQEDSLIIDAPLCQYTVQGLSLIGLERLRLTMRIVPQSAKHLTPYIDTLDLYNSRHRDRLVKGLEDEFHLAVDKILPEIKSLIPLLEEIRLKQREEKGDNLYQMSDAEKTEALASLKDPKLMDHLLKDLESLMIGEEKAKLLGYLGTISRLMDQPLGVLIVSRSGAGKTTLQDALCRLIPEESINRYTRLTSQALFYTDEKGLKNKVLSIEEEDGMKEALYSIRTLQSSQRLTVVSTRSDPKSGKLKAEEYTVEGPVFIMISTTNPDALDFETRNRFIIITINESEEQTKRIMEARKESFTLEGKLKAADLNQLIKRSQNMQRLLKPIEVINPYAKRLEYPFDKLQMRREFNKYMVLINSIALLHQYQREIKTYEKEGISHPYIEVELSDIALANKLVMEFFPHSLDEMAPHTRCFTEELHRLMVHKGGEITFTRKEIRDFSGWSDWSVRKALEQLETLGYVRKVSGQNGVAFHYELLIDATLEKRRELLLTDVEELRKSIEP